MGVGIACLVLFTFFLLAIRFSLNMVLGVGFALSAQRCFYFYSLSNSEGHLLLCSFFFVFLFRSDTIGAVLKVVVYMDPSLKYSGQKFVSS